MSKQDGNQRVGKGNGDTILLLIDRNPHDKGHHNKKINKIDKNI